MLDSDKYLFEKGCFLPSWVEDNPAKQETKMLQHKDLATLLSELADIKKHIEDVRERSWVLARKIQFHNNNFVME